MKFFQLKCQNSLELRLIEDLTLLRPKYFLQSFIELIYSGIRTLDTRMARVINPPSYAGLS